MQAAEVPRSLPADPRIGELAYDASQVFLITVGQGVATHIVLAPDEKILVSAAGAPADCRQEGTAWCIAATVGANEFFVQPRQAAALRNNLQLATNLRRYSFDFVQEANRPPFYRVTFRYPEAVPAAAAARPPAPAQCNWSYSMQAAAGSQAIAPLAVFDDGRQTYVLLPPDAAAPEILGLSSPAVLPAAVIQPGSRLLAMPGVGSGFRLRDGWRTVTVWNEGVSNPAGAGPCPAWER